MKKIMIGLIIAFSILIEGCSGGRVVIYLPDVVSKLVVRANVPIYNKSSYFMEVYVMGKKVAEMPPGESFHTVASVPFRGMEIPITALLYDSKNMYVGCSVKEMRLYTACSFKVENRNINYVRGKSSTDFCVEEYKRKGWAVKKLPTPYLKHDFMLQVVYNGSDSGSGILRINGNSIRKFDKYRPRIYFLKKNLMNSNHRNHIIIDMKYLDKDDKILGYSREHRKSTHIYRPEACCVIF